MEITLVQAIEKVGQQILENFPTRTLKLESNPIQFSQLLESISKEIIYPIKILFDEKTGRNAFEMLPKVLLEEVFSYVLYCDVNMSEVLKMSRVCKKWKNLVWSLVKEVKIRPVKYLNRTTLGQIEKSTQKCQNLERFSLVTKDNIRVSRSLLSNWRWKQIRKLSITLNFTEESTKNFSWLKEIHSLTFLSIFHMTSKIESFEVWPPNLVCLKFGECLLFKQTLSNLPKGLEKLYIVDCKVDSVIRSEDIPQSLVNSVKKFRLEFTQNINLLRRLENLNDLSLAGMQGDLQESFFSQIRKPEEIISIDLRETNFNKIEILLENFQTLTSINLSDCHLEKESIPKLNGFHFLKKLDLSRCTSVNFFSISKIWLPQLEFLFLSGCENFHLESFLFTHHSNSSLKYLDISHTKVVEMEFLPSTIVSLDISNNQFIRCAHLRKIPSSVRNLNVDSCFLIRKEKADLFYSLQNVCIYGLND